MQDLFYNFWKILFVPLFIIVRITLAPCPVIVAEILLAVSLNAAPVFVIHAAISQLFTVIGCSTNANSSRGTPSEGINFAFQKISSPSR